MILCNSMTGAVLVSLVESLKQVLQNLGAELERNRKGMTVLMHGRMAENMEAEIRSRLSFLEAFRDSIHSIVVVGSAAHAAIERGSDIDIVIVCKKEGLETVLSAVCDREVGSAVNGRGERSSTRS